ncbi:MULTISPECIES: cytochrome-c oxidase [Rhodomicrobium]|uniref:cytochrome-c oxidase n=1 Tax=Rhodomicrobium TaxID=1068 RepID=UPI000B4A8748|nr:MULTISPECIES: cytochrome-c oxidase [Rhodomicrobium]
MPRIDLSFLLLGAACLICGVCLGIYMGINQDFQLSPVHAHLNLVGWASLALFGVIYRAFPELLASRLARVHFWLAAPSALAFPLGVYFAAIHHQPGLAIVASLLWLAGAIVFFISAARLATLGGAIGER